MPASEPSSAAPESPEVTLGSVAPEDRRAVSWGAVLAGAVTALAMLVMLSLAGLAIGVGVTDPTSSDPFDAVAWSTGLWVVLAAALSLGVGGLVTGLLASRAGLLHGVVTWAAAVVALVLALSLTGGTAFGAVGALEGATGSAAGPAEARANAVVADAVERVVDDAVDDLDGLEGRQFSQRVELALADTGEERLQPGYLSDQAEDARVDIEVAGNEVLADPGNARPILEELSENLAARGDDVVDGLDRKSIAETMRSTLGFVDPEATDASDTIAGRLESAQAQLERVGEGLETASGDLEETIDDARRAAEDTSEAAGRAAMFALLAIAVGVVVAALFSLAGSRHAGKRRATSRDD